MSNMTPDMIAALVIGLLCALLLAAAWTDVKSRRIPNRLVLLGAVSGLLLNTVLPQGYGFTSALPGALGFWLALAGLGLGFVIRLPLYLLRAMGGWRRQADGDGGGVHGAECDQQLFPLIFCIFPALLLVLLGPAMIQIYRVLLPTMAGQ